MSRNNIDVTMMMFMFVQKKGRARATSQKSGARKPHLSISHFDKNKDQKVVTYKRHFPIDGNIFPKKRVTMPNLENRGVGYETVSIRGEILPLIFTI
jgi:hypothetical protein